MSQANICVVDINPIIDNAKLNNMHRLTVLWCAFIIVLTVSILLYWVWSFLSSW